MQLTRESLRWLFSAEYADGSIIEQDQDDRCQSRKDGKGSRFTDVLAHPERLTAFHLLAVDSPETVSVDLITGAFVVNGTPIHIHDQNFDPMRHELKLVYFRETRVEQVLNPLGESVSDRHFTNRYFIGWVTTEAYGKTKQVTLAVG